MRFRVVVYFTTKQAIPIQETIKSNYDSGRGGAGSYGIRSSGLAILCTILSLSLSNIVPFEDQAPHMRLDFTLPSTVEESIPEFCQVLVYVDTCMTRIFQLPASLIQLFTGSEC